MYDKIDAFSLLPFNHGHKQITKFAVDCESAVYCKILFKFAAKNCKKVTFLQQQKV